MSIIHTLSHSFTFFLSYIFQNHGYMSFLMLFQFVIHSVSQSHLWTFRYILAFMSRIELSIFFYLKCRLRTLNNYFVSNFRTLFLSYCLYIHLSGCLFFGLSVSFLICHLLRSYGQSVLVFTRIKMNICFQ